jgi:hypothetical protein
MESNEKEIFMSRTSDASNVTRREFLVGAGSIAATGYLVVGTASNNASARTSPLTTNTYIVTIDVTTTPIAYSTPQLPDASNLSVNAGDIVTWKAKTSGAKHHSAVLFIADTPFIDKHGNPVYAFHGSKSDETNGIGKNASIDPKASGSYEYCVGVWDEEKLSTYTDDPTIIIGKVNVGAESAIAKLIAVDRELKKAALAYAVESEKIKSIENEVEALIDQLKKQLRSMPQT